MGWNSFLHHHQKSDEAKIVDFKFTICKLIPITTILLFRAIDFASQSSGSCFLFSQVLYMKLEAYAILWIFNAVKVVSMHIRENSKYQKLGFFLAELFKYRINTTERKSDILTNDFLEKCKNHKHFSFYDLEKNRKVCLFQSSTHFFHHLSSLLAFWLISCKNIPKINESFISELLFICHQSTYMYIIIWYTHCKS